MEIGKLYICKDGGFEELAEIDSLDGISIEEKEEDKRVIGIDLASSCDFTGECYINPQVLLSLFLSKPVSNNWMKMHGGVMRRRKQKWTNKNKNEEFD